MLGTVWGWITAGIGAVSTVLLVVYGTQSGTWVDEHQPSGMPSVLPLLVVTLLAIVLFLGGLVVGLVGAVAHRKRARSL